MSSAFDRYCSVVPHREAMWGQASEIVQADDCIDEALTPDNITDIIYNKTDCSPYDMISECGNWIKKFDNIAGYLSRYFFSADDVWLAYVMAVFYALEWNGSAWVDISRCPDSSNGSVA